MNPWTFLLLFALLVALDLGARTLTERRARRSRDAFVGELAFHRHEMRAIDGRAARSREALTAALRDAEAHLVDALAPCAAVPARCSLPPRRARRADGRPDEVRRAVWREVVAHPRALGAIVFVTDPRAPWRPMHVALPGELAHPAVLVTMWGAA